MRKSFLLILIASLPTIAQVPDSVLAYYPLHTGNYWEYTEFASEWDYLYWQRYFCLEVTGDTLMENGKSYKILQKQYIPDTLETTYYFERVDTLTGNIFRYCNKYDFIDNEYKIDSLNIQLGDTVAASRNYPSDANENEILCQYLISDTLFNQSFQTKYFACISFIPGFSYRLAKGIGLVRFTFGGEIAQTYQTLKYARINNVEYGNKLPTYVQNESSEPGSFSLNQNYPNPFNPSTKISYNLDRAAQVSLIIYDTLGRQVRSLVNKHQDSGHHTINVNFNDIAAGVYFYQLKSRDQIQTRKMLLLR